ncbi:hypothetical protein ACTXMF_12175 [Psychrobacter celer]|uniref:hypothetical protein n=1 Tax=Psychrobacter celer TaxID=306572 RepID=UPI003FD1622F
MIETTEVVKCDLCKREGATKQLYKRFPRKYFCDMVFGVEINVVGYGANVEHICKECAYDALREFARKNLGMTDTLVGGSDE